MINVAYVFAGEKIFKSNNVSIYNTRHKYYCLYKKIRKIYYYDNCIEKIRIVFKNNKVYYSVKIITVCKFGIKIQRVNYIIDTK